MTAALPGARIHCVEPVPPAFQKLTAFCAQTGGGRIRAYNLALGEARAKQTLDYLTSLDLPSTQLRTISYGKEKPICTDHDEDCWQKNRRTHITQAQASSD